MLCGWVAGQRVPVLAAVGRCVWEGWTSCAISLMAWGHSASDTSAAATCFRWQADCMVVRQHKAGNMCCRVRHLPSKSSSPWRHLAYLLCPQKCFRQLTVECSRTRGGLIGTDTSLHIDGRFVLLSSLCSENWCLLQLPPHAFYTCNCAKVGLHSLMLC